ncbi:MAG TPA: YicC family protein [Saprospiraceae bacterium]|nr:YicC family protein [Saprospiraceae bacterium]HMQ81695.1 YicC family protein [Saprospiraceae bacterium]
MLLSMTGYGRVERGFKDQTIVVELRSLNSKFSDMRVKIPQRLKEKEPELRRLVTEKIQRGKVDLSIDVGSMMGEEGYAFNKELFKKYFRELSALADELGIDKGDLINTIVRMPNVVATALEKIDEAEWLAVLSALEDAIVKFEAFRAAEGDATEIDMRLRVKNILEALTQVDPFEEQRIVALRQRLNQNLENYLGKDKVDANRFEQEILFYLEKMDVTEEKVRLEQHCKFFLEELNNNEVLKGRKLSFISQEMGREINTLGAKAYSSDIQRLVVAMKDELEKIKEQVANLV